MIDAKTLDKTKQAIEHMVKARRLIEDIIDAEKGDWTPGNGPKPERMRAAEQTRYDLIDLSERFEMTYA